MRGIQARDMLSPPDQPIDEAALRALDNLWSTYSTAHSIRNSAFLIINISFIPLLLWLNQHFRHEFPLTIADHGNSDGARIPGPVNCAVRGLNWFLTLLRITLVTKCGLLLVVGLHRIEHGKFVSPASAIVTVNDTESRGSYTLQYLVYLLEWLILPVGFGLRLFWHVCGGVTLLDTQTCDTSPNRYRYPRSSVTLEEANADSDLQLENQSISVLQLQEAEVLLRQIRLCWWICLLIDLLCMVIVFAITAPCSRTRPPRAHGIELHEMLTAPTARSTQGVRVRVSRTNPNELTLPLGSPAHQTLSSISLHGAHIDQRHNARVARSLGLIYQDVHPFNTARINQPTHYPSPNTTFSQAFASLCGVSTAYHSHPSHTLPQRSIQSSTVQPRVSNNSTLQSDSNFPRAHCTLDVNNRQPTLPIQRSTHEIFVSSGVGLIERDSRSLMLFMLPERPQNYERPTLAQLSISHHPAVRRRDIQRLPTYRYESLICVIRKKRDKMASTVLTGKTLTNDEKAESTHILDNSAVSPTEKTPDERSLPLLPAEDIQQSQTLLGGARTEGTSIPSCKPEPSATQEMGYSLSPQNGASSTQRLGVQHTAISEDNTVINRDGHNLASCSPVHGLQQGNRLHTSFSTEHSALSVESEVPCDENHVPPDGVPSSKLSCTSALQEYTSDITGKTTTPELSTSAGVNLSEKAQEMESSKPVLHELSSKSAILHPAESTNPSVTAQVHCTEIIELNDNEASENISPRSAVQSPASPCISSCSSSLLLPSSTLSSAADDGREHSTDSQFVDNSIQHLYYLTLYPKLCFLIIVCMDIVTTLTDLIHIPGCCSIPMIANQRNTAEADALNTAVYRFVTWMNRCTSIQSEDIWYSESFTKVRETIGSFFRFISLHVATVSRHTLKRFSACLRSSPTVPHNVTYADPFEGVLPDTVAEETPCCCICCNNYAPKDWVVVLPCGSGHYFHRHCARAWLLRHATCPLCRSVIFT